MQVFIQIHCNCYVQASYARYKVQLFHTTHLIQANMTHTKPHNHMFPYVQQIFISFPFLPMVNQFRWFARQVSLKSLTNEKAMDKEDYACYANLLPILGIVSIIFHCLQSRNDSLENCHLMKSCHLFYLSYWRRIFYLFRNSYFCPTSCRIWPFFFFF